MNFIFCRYIAFCSDLLGSLTLIHFITSINHSENVLLFPCIYRITSTELEPLQAQLSELDQGIADQLDAIAAVKSNIIRNDEKMNKMLSSVAFSR